jgi:hypothetical protein
LETTDPKVVIMGWITLYAVILSRSAWFYVKCSEGFCSSNSTGSEIPRFTYAFSAQECCAHAYSVQSSRTLGHLPWLGCQK